MAIREDEEATQIFGYRTRSFKAVIWILSAMIAGLAGGLFAGWVRFVIRDRSRLASRWLS